jgi:hypothetical protein
MGLYVSVACIAYAIGGQKLLRKIVPGMAEKHRESNSQIDGQENIAAKK